jgi:CRP-like cAMP-binding protein
MEQVPECLRKCAVLQGMSDAELLELLRVVRHEQFAPGTEILSEGLAYQSLWILLEGKCSVVKNGAHQRSELAQLGPGSIFGEMSFLEDSAHSAAVIAITRCDTIRLMREDYERLRVSSPNLAQQLTLNIVRILAERLRRMDRWICELVELTEYQQRSQEWQQFRAKLYAGLDS